MTPEQLDAIQARAENGDPDYHAHANAIEDRRCLLAYARDLEARIGRVEALADGWVERYGPESRMAEVFGPQKVSIKFAVGEIRAALTATEGQA